MNWLPFDQPIILDQICDQSHIQPVLIFKHSTRCAISSMALSRLEREDNLEIPAYLLDLVKFRALSNQVAEQFSVAHESPQVLLIYQATAAFHASHYEISAAAVRAAVAELAPGV